MATEESATSNELSAGGALCRLDASELAQRIRDKEVSPVEVVSAHLERIAEINPVLNAIIDMNETARSEAAIAEQAVMRGDSLGPLHGVPFTVKDSFDITGFRSSRGSLLFVDHVATETATPVRRLTKAGGILLGKTNLPEFVLWAETDNRPFGATRNPWDLDRTPGGSSGGEGAAISAGMSPLGIGSDLAGSIRLPAHYCGIFGMKPTHARVPLTGHWPQTLQRYTHAGPMTRSARDLKLALAIMEGPDGRDWYTERARPSDDSVEAGIDGLRVGWVAGDSFGPLDAGVRQAFEAAIAAVGGVVADVSEVQIPSLAHDWDDLTMGLYAGESAAYFQQFTQGREDDLSDVLRQRLATEPPSLDDYVSAETAVQALRDDLLAYFREFDLLICPVSPVTAPPRGLPHLTINGQQRRGRSALRATIPFDVAGVPAVSVPCATSPDGLPIGIQVVGGWGKDVQIIFFAEALLNATTGRRTALVAPYGRDPGTRRPESALSEEFGAARSGATESPEGMGR